MGRLLPLAALLAILAATVTIVPDALSQQQLTAPPVLRGTAELVNVLVTVRDQNHRLINSLDKTSFRIFEDGKLQEIKYFTRQASLPLTIGLLIDSSPGQGDLLSSERDVSMEFFSTVLRDRDLAFLINFDTSVNLLTDFTNQLTLLQRGLDGVRVGGGYGNGPIASPIPSKTGSTHLHDALYLAAAEKLAGEVGRKALILVASGDDQGSKTTLDEAIGAAQKVDAAVYGIRYVDRDLCWARFLLQSIPEQHVLERIAGETGGRVMNPGKGQELRKAYVEIAEDLRSQYSIGYLPANATLDGSFRKIEIKVNQPNLRVQSRRGYFAIPPAER